MNREIKFRAWDTVTKQMIFTGFHLFGEVTCFDMVGQWLFKHPDPDDEDKSSLERLNDVEITQFTGLLDSAGREIYEGDILELCGPEDFNNHYGLVEFKDGSFRMFGSYSGLKNWLKWATIKSNIFQNPEIIDQSNR